MERETESYVFSGFGNGLSRGWERKSTAGRFATCRFWPCTRKISSVGKDEVNNWEFFIYLKLRLFVFAVFQRIFSSWVLAPTYFTIFIRGLSTFCFNSLIKLSCRVGKEVLWLCVYNNKKKYPTWMLAWMPMFSSTNHSFAALTRELSSSTLEEKFNTYMRPCIIFYCLLLLTLSSLL